MKRITILFAVLFVIMSAAGCTKKSTDGALASALENIKPALLLIEQRYTLYQTALEAAGVFLASPEEETREAAEQSLVDSMSALSSFTAVKSELSDDEEKNLVKLGLNLADYQVPFELEEYNRVSAVMDLGVLLSLLEEETTDMAAFEQSLTLLCKNNDTFRQVDFLCINELFCQFQGSEIDDFKDDFLPSLKTLSSDGLPCDTDSAALEARANMLMDSAEDDISAYAEFVGTQYAALLTLQKNIGAIMSDAGYEDSEEVQSLLEKGIGGFTE